MELEAPSPFFRSESLERYFFISSLFLPHIHHSLGNGSTIRFWYDKWASNQALRVVFPRMFNFSTKQNAFISDILVLSNWNLHLKHNLRDFEIDDLSSPLAFFALITPSPPSPTPFFGPFLLMGSSRSLPSFPLYLPTLLLFTTPPFGIL